MPSIKALRKAIRESSSYARADRDLELLERTELRSIRLQLEYLKPELALSDYGVAHTIVVFGSTRLPSPESARQLLAEIDAAATANRAEDTQRVALARKALERAPYYEVGREFGRLVALYGDGPRDDRLVVMTGGGAGGMEAANRGAHEAGAASIGLNITLPREQEPNPYITPELCLQFRYFALRKLHFMLRAKALVALPGGYGTFDELFETLCLIQTRKREALPVVLVGESFWRRAVDFDFLAEEGMIDPADLELFRFAETAQEAWDAIIGWYAERNRSIFEAADPEVNDAEVGVEP